MQTDVGPGLSFRAMARNEVRSFMVGTGQPDYPSLVNVLTQEAQAIGINLPSWPYDVAAPFEHEVNAVMQEVQQCVAAWTAHGKPTPPPIKGF